MFNFRNGTALAVQQDIYIKRYLAEEKLSSKEICDMKQNLWVAAASKLAPSNLVIRQWALIDLFSNSAQHVTAIFKMMDILTYKEKGPYKIWAESYSYFGYTMDVLKLWVKKFKYRADLSAITDIIDKVNLGAIVTSYLRNGVWYPAPYGDLRDIPLNPDLQIPHEVKTLAISNVIFNFIVSDNLAWYSVKGRPIGFNTHIPKDSYNVNIIKGVPVGFKFYEGYDKKYKSSMEEHRDTFDLKRLKSVFFC